MGPARPADQQRRPRSALTAGDRGNPGRVEQDDWSQSDRRLPRCREAFKIMEKQETGGRIINLGSSSARLASGPGHSPYRASKHGMMGFSKNILLEGKDKKIGVTVINPSHVKTPMTEIIDQGLYDESLPAYLEGWLDEKELREGIHASCIDVENVADIALYVATRTPDVTIPQVALYPTHKVHRYGMEV
ncbi:MAG: SDR family oxidoreductase [Caldilineales bacterium]